jgi:hypothetical protein
VENKYLEYKKGAANLRFASQFAQVETHCAAEREEALHKFQIHVDRQLPVAYQMKESGEKTNKTPRMEKRPICIIVHCVLQLMQSETLASVLTAACSQQTHLEANSHKCPRLKKNPPSGDQTNLHNSPIFESMTHSLWHEQLAHQTRRRAPVSDK